MADLGSVISRQSSAILKQPAMKNRHEYCYVIIDSQGSCWRITNDGYDRQPGLPTLLADGWRPVRETPYHQVPYILILLERDADDAKGFGFANG